MEYIQKSETTTYEVLTQDITGYVPKKMEAVTHQVERRP